MKQRIYKYWHNGTYLYGQGVNEEYIRIAIETKLELNEGTLPAGSVMSYKHERKVTSREPNTYWLKKRLRLSDSTDVSTLTFNDIINTSKLPPIIINKIVGAELGVSTNVLRKLQNYNVKDVIKLSNNKLQVKCHKIVQKNPRGADIVISRVDEIRDNLIMLLDLDYKLIVHYNNYIERCDLLTRRLRKVLPYEEKEKLANELIDLKKKLKVEDKITHNTGYYVQTDDEYEYDSMKKMIDKFDKIHLDLSNKIDRLSFNRMKFNDLMSFDDALGMYQVVRRRTNDNML